MCLACAVRADAVGARGPCHARRDRHVGSPCVCPSACLVGGYCVCPSVCLVDRTCVSVRSPGPWKSCPHFFFCIWSRNSQLKSISWGVPRPEKKTGRAAPSKNHSKIDFVGSSFSQNHLAFCSSHTLLFPPRRPTFGPPAGPSKL